MLEAGEEFVSVKETTAEDGKPNLEFRMDRSKIKSVGQPAIKKFLLLLQVSSLGIYWYLWQGLLPPQGKS